MGGQDCYMLQGKADGNLNGVTRMRGGTHSEDVVGGQDFGLNESSMGAESFKISIVSK